MGSPIMLARVANSLYWSARYFERAANTAQLLLVTANAEIQLQGIDPKGADPSWRLTREMIGSDDFHGAMLDGEMEGSVLFSLTMARENARAIRGDISSEMWEALNVLFLQTTEASRSEIDRSDVLDIARQIGERAHLLQGMRDNMMMRGDAWHFLRLGRHSERAMWSALLLNSMCRNLPSSDALTFLYLGTVLRSVNGFEAYSRALQTISPEKVMEFLLLEDRFPKSVHFCVQEMTKSLHTLSQTPEDVFTNEAEQIGGSLLSRLRFADADDVLANVDGFLQGIVQDLIKLSSSVVQEYFP